MALKKFGSLLKIAATGTALEDVIVDKPAVEKKVLEARNNEFMYFRARAISAGDQGPTKGEPYPNGNGDYFPRKELESAYQTFIGKNLFLNHESDHPIKSVGKILDAYPVEDPETGEYYVECLAKIDKKLHPEIARKVETGELNTVSMGCSCEASRCSICGLEIHSDEDQKCDHLKPTGILKTFTAEIDIPECGVIRGHPTLAYSINSGLSFNELSIVNVPADANAFIKGVIASNLKHQITKKASLDETERKYLQELLSSLDEDTKKQIKADFCACELPKEDKHMSDKVKNASEEPKTTTQEDTVREVLTKMNALQYIEFANWMENKFNKTATEPVKKEAKEEVKPEPVKDAVKPVEDSIIERAISAVKNSTLGKLFSNAVKREIEKGATSSETKPVSVELRAEFATDKEDFGKSHWTLYKGDRRILRAYVDQLWDKEQLTEEKYVKWTSSTEYGKKLIETYKRLGFAKTAELLGVGQKVLKSGEKSKVDKEVEKTQDVLHKADETSIGDHLESSKPESDQKKEASETSINKEAVSPPGWEKTVEKMKKHKKITNPWALSWWMKEKGYEPEKKSFLEAYDEYETELKKKADETVVKDIAPKIEDLKVEEAPIVEDVPKVEPEVKPEIVQPESAFDKLDDGIIVAEGIKAEKDKESGEIVITDASGTEIKRLPDGFGTDVPSVMKLLQVVVGISETKEEVPKIEEAPKEEAPKIEEPKVEEPKLEEKPIETHSSKESESLDKHAEELSKKEAELKAKEAEINAKRFADSVQARTNRCKKIVATMLQKEMLSMEEADVTSEISKGATLLDAREAALRKVVERKVKALLSMDEKALNEFEQSINEVQIKKEASKRLTTPINLTYNLPTEDDEYKSIFDSMGSGSESH